MEMNDGYTTHIAEEEWQHARRKVIYEKVVCAITGCSVELLPFEDVRRQLHLNQKLYRGLQEIPLERIRGSVGRYDDFTVTFLPRKEYLRDRWKTVDKASMAGKTPPIEVYQVGQAYFVVDGNHRVSVARQHGAQTIEAYVTEFPTSLGYTAKEDVDQHLIQTEYAAFVEKAGEAGARAAGEIRLSCPGCYADLVTQIEMYRQGQENKTGKAVSFSQAFSDWHEEVYTTAVEAIRKHNLMTLFPDRTEADLFVWAWQNHEVLEQQAT